MFTNNVKLANIPEESQQSGQLPSQVALTLAQPESAERHQSPEIDDPSCCCKNTASEISANSQL